MVTVRTNRFNFQQFYMETILRLGELYGSHNKQELFALYSIFKKNNKML